MTARCVQRRGMTTTELIVVFVAISIVGMITAMAAVSVLDATKNRRADANVTEVLLAEQRFAAKWGQFTGRPEDLDDFDGFVVVEDPSTQPDEVSVAVGTQGSLGIAAKRGDLCVTILAGAPDAGGGTRHRELDTDQACDGANAFEGDETEEAPGADGRPVSKIW